MKHERLTAKLAAVAGIVRASAPPPPPSDQAVALLRAQFTRVKQDGGVSVPYSACETNAGTLEDWESLRAAGYVEPRHGESFAGKTHEFSVALTERGRKFLKGEK